MSNNEESSGKLLGPDQADALEALDRDKPNPGGEPQCPVCGLSMVRHVEKHLAPGGGTSSFRVRLVCPSVECGSWTVYDW